MIWFIPAGGPDLDQLIAAALFVNLRRGCATIGHGALAALHNRKNKIS
jgi:hypothetical protein